MSASSNAFLGAACALAISLSAAPARAHGGGYGGGGTGASGGPPSGGTYTGPGDVLPPPGPGSGSGSAKPAAAAPGTGTPSPPGPPLPATPGGPTTPPGPTGNGPATLGPGSGPDGSQWQAWWAFNRWPYLDLRRRVAAGVVVTGSDEFFLGRPAVALDALRPSRSTVEREVVPVLLEALERDGSKDVRSSALIALGKTRAGPRALRAIRPFLAHRNQEVAESAAVALGILGEVAGLDLLGRVLAGDVEGLQREDGLSFGAGVPERTRAFAAYALGSLHASSGPHDRLRLVRELTRALAGQRASSPDVTTACVLALGLAPLSPDPEHEDGSGAETEAATVLVSLQQEVRFLLARLERGRLDDLSRAHVPVSLARLARDLPEGSALTGEVARRLELIARGDEDANAALRRGAVLGIGILGLRGSDGGKGAREALLALAAQCPDPIARQLALIALAEAAGRSARPEVAEEAEKTLSSVLADGSPGLRPWACLALGLLARAARESELEGRADSLRLALAGARSPRDEGACAVALGIAGDARAAELLRTRLEEASDPELRGHFALALGMLGDRAALPSIRDLVRTSRLQGDLMRSAAIALGLLGDQEIARELVGELQASSSLAARAAIASALGLIGDARAIEPLKRLALDPGQPDLARAFAIVALGGIADGRDLPWNTPLSCGSNYVDAPPTLTAADAAGVLDIL